MLFRTIKCVIGFCSIVIVLHSPYLVAQDIELKGPSEETPEELEEVSAEQRERDAEKRKKEPNIFQRFSKKVGSRVRVNIIEVKVTAPYAEWHSGPGRGYPVTHVSEQGELLYLIKQRTTWVKAKDKRGHTGWIKRSALSDTLLNNVPYGEEPSTRDYVSHPWQLSGTGGDFGGADTLGLSLGYRITSNITTEFSIAQATGRFSDSKLAYLGVTHQPFPEWRLSPFFTLGAGKIKTTPNTRVVQSEDRTDSTLKVGAGAFYYLTRRFMLRIGYNNHMSLTSRDENEETHEWKVGFTAFF